MEDRNLLLYAEMVDGRPYYGSHCFRHGKDNEGKTIQVQLKCREVEGKKYIACPKCLMRIEVKHAT